MNERVYKLNKLYAITDTLMCVVTIVAFAVCAVLFSKWWLNLFDFVPLFLFSSHTVVMDGQFVADRIAADAPEEDIECMQVQDGDYDDR